MTEIKTLVAPKVPRLNSKTIVVNDAAWDALVAYMQLQSDTINALSNAISALENHSNLQFKNINASLKTLASEMSEIAAALEGVYIDE